MPTHWVVDAHESLSIVPPFVSRLCAEVHVVVLA
jgi:hypothetical protein